MSENGWKVSIEGVTRAFGAVRAIDHLSFEFGPGEVFGFIGPNGAGKTTTLRILATLDDPDEGDVRYGGDSILEVPDRIRARVGFVPDRQGVYTHLTVHEYLDFFARAYSLRGDDRVRGVHEILEFAGLAPISDRPCTGLSKGMRQRLSFARALIHDPDVLLLDEPMEGLDPRARIEFRELLLALARQGKAILVSSHILTELSEFVDRVVILERGRLVASGKLGDLARELGSASAVRIRLREDQDPEAVERHLLERPGVVHVHPSGFELTVEMTGEGAEGDRLVHDLFEAGFRVEGFDSEEPDLEDLFLHLTEGELG